MKKLIKQLGTIDELLSLRESLKSQMRKVNNLIKQGIETTKQLPDRWYVENPSQNVIDYLNKKYNKNIVLDANYEDCGFGELHNEYAFIPADVEYSWKITQEEFELALSFLSEA